jgi:phosphoglycolate phosphatase
MTRLVIFDLDGTLLDTIEDLGTSTNYALALHGFPTHSIDAYRFFVGNGMTKLIERALPETARDESTIIRVKSDFMRYYAAHAEAKTKPYPGIPELLHKLNEQNIALAVASNKVHAATVRLIGHFFPEIHFSVVLGQRENFPIKPDPAIVSQILHQTGVSREEALYVGDSGVDVRTAINAGVPAVAVLWGFRPKSELEEKGATCFASHPSDIISLIFN